MDYRRISLTDQETFERWYAAKMEEQGNACAICRKPFGDTHADKPFVDHDHRHCGKRNHCPACRRGLLCLNCNYSIGVFKGDIALLARAIAYLDNAPVDLSQPSYTKCWGKSQTWEHRTDLKLDMEKAREIRRLRAQGVPRKQVADRFGICEATVKAVTSHRAWREPS